MQYHALALAVNAGDVDLVGLEGAEVPPTLSAEPRIHLHRLPDRAFVTRAAGGVRRFVFGSVMRAVMQGVRLFTVLMRLPRPGLILVQNPPAVPTLAVAWLVARLRGARLVIDWHNLAHTVAAIRLGDDHRAVRAIARSERRWARRADGHLAVSRELAAWLQREYGIAVRVVYDRPARAFAPVTAAEAGSMWARLAAQGVLPATRVPLAVCPTSWTPDEDFDLLLEALERADRTLGGNFGGGNPSGLPDPKLSVLLTGRGALRASFEARVAKRHFTSILVRTAWLEPADYPLVVGMADVGLCLHQSSSGLDLPMKVQDFRGAAVPVAAFAYAPVLGEVLTVGQEGVTFRDPGELAALLVLLAAPLPHGDALARPRAWLREHPATRWDDEWLSAARTSLNPPEPP